MPDSSVFAVPRDFLCEHAASKSRVLAVLARPGHLDSVQTVLTCTNPILATEVVGLLLRAMANGHGPSSEADRERLAALMPAPVAASLRQAFDWVCEGAWPVPAHAHFPLPNGTDEDADPVHLSEPSTPHDARLTELPGKVVRIIRMIELHVHDPGRMRAAALATDWEPADPTDLLDDDPLDLVGAAMALTDDLPTIPGTHELGSESTGELLDVDDGDDLAAWTAQPITVTFMTGWRLRHHQTQEVDATLPDFAKLFPLTEDADSWRLTPRTASALHRALSQLADEAYDDVNDYGDRPITGDDDEWMVLDRLPRISWKQNQLWRRQAARAADDLCRDLERGDWPLPRCNAEELMLHLAISDAEDAVNDEIGTEYDRTLPSHEDDYDWDLCSEMLFQDHDILLLYEGWADGVENPDGDVNKFMRIGDLRPENWFTPFRNVEPRDPDRGFRR